MLARASFKQTAISCNRRAKLVDLSKIINKLQIKIENNDIPAAIEKMTGVIANEQPDSFMTEAMRLFHKGNIFLQLLRRNVNVAANRASGISPEMNTGEIQARWLISDDMVPENFLSSIERDILRDELRHNPEAIGCYVWENDIISEVERLQAQDFVETVNFSFNDDQQDELLSNLNRIWFQETLAALQDCLNEAVDCRTELETGRLVQINPYDLLTGSCDMQDFIKDTPVSPMNIQRANMPSSAIIDEIKVLPLILSI